MKKIILIKIMEGMDKSKKICTIFLLFFNPPKRKEECKNTE